MIWYSWLKENTPTGFKSTKLHNKDTRMLDSGKRRLKIASNLKTHPHHTHVHTQSPSAFSFTELKYHMTSVCDKNGMDNGRHWRARRGDEKGKKKAVTKRHIIMEHPNSAPFQKPCLMTSSYQATEHSRTSFPELAPLLSALNKRLLYTQTDMYRWHHKRRTHKSWIPRTETPKHQFIHGPNHFSFF